MSKDRFLRIFLYSVLLILLVTGCSKSKNKSATKETQSGESSGAVTVSGTQLASVIEGLWAGAFELGKELVYLRVELKSEDEDIKLTVLSMLPGAPGVVGDVRLESSRVNFELTRDSDTIAFDGQLQGDTITGVVEHAGESGTFGLVRWVQVDATIYDDYMGAYELDTGRVVFIRRHDFLKLDPPYPISTSWLSYVEESGRVGRLYPSSETTFFSGPTYLVPFPVEVEVTFVRNQEGKVSGLVWRERGDDLVTGLDVSRGWKRHTGEGVGYGLVLGLVAGGFVGAKTYEPPPPPPPCPRFVCIDVLPDLDLGWVPRMFIGAGIGAGIGAVAGALVGFAIKTEQWEEAPLDRLRMSLGPQRDGRFGFGASVRF